MPKPLLALAALVVAAGTVNADYLTPDSILRPPPATYPGDGSTPVNQADYVTTQYAALGLLFPVRELSPTVTYTTAVASVNGVNAWAPVLTTGPGITFPGGLAMDAVGIVVGDFNHPVASVAVDLALQGNARAWLTGFRGDGSSVFASVDATTGLHHLSVDGGGFVEFSAGVFPNLSIPPISELPVDFSPFAWGVAGVDIPGRPVFTVPEPGSLVLAALGALGLLARRARASRPKR